MIFPPVRSGALVQVSCSLTGTQRARFGRAVFTSPHFLGLSRMGRGRPIGVFDLTRRWK